MSWIKIRRHSHIMANFLSADAPVFVMPPSSNSNSTASNTGQAVGGGKKDGVSQRNVGRNEQRRRSKRRNNNTSNRKKRGQGGGGQSGKKGDGNGNNRTKKAPQIDANFLGFRYEREEQSDYFPSSFRTHRANSKPMPKFNRETFLTSKFRFVMHPSALSESMGVLDLGRSVDWDAVEEVIVDVKDEEADLQCPICLCSPLVPVMSSCGHAYCKMCVLRHLDSRADRADHVRCPICYTNVFERDLRSVRKRAVVDIGKEKAKKGGVSMCLMYREKDKAIPQFAYHETMDLKLSAVHNFPDPHSTQQGTFFQFLKATKAWVRAIISRELKELKEVVSEALSDSIYLEALGHEEAAQKEKADVSRLANVAKRHMAEKALQWNLEDMMDQISYVDEEAAMAAAKAASKNQSELFSQDDFPSLGGEKPKAAVAPNTGGAGGRGQGEQVATGASAMDIGWAADCLPEFDAAIAGSRNDGYYFYQLPTGQKAFLHSFCVQLLKEEFKTYDKFPAVLSGPVLDVETVNLSPDTLKFFKYLHHLNGRAEIDFVELDVHAYLSDGTRKKFKKEIQKRKRQRSKKASSPQAARAMNTSALERTFSHDCPRLADPVDEKERMERLDIRNYPQIGTPPSMKPSGDPHGTMGGVDMVESRPELSFARITQNMGFFPTLGESENLPKRKTTQKKKTTGVWGK